MQFPIRFIVLSLCLVFGIGSGASAQSAQGHSGEWLVAQSGDELKPRFRYSDPAPRRNTAPAGGQPAPAGYDDAAVAPTPTASGQQNELSLQQAVQEQQTGLPATGGNETRGFSLGQGDVIGFSMFGQPDMSTTAFVSSSGTVSLPLVGEVKVEGMTPVEAEQRIAKAFAKGGYFRDPQVNITIEQYRSQQVSVLGEVAKPGRYPLETQTTVLDVLAVAGGRTATGSSVVTVVRNTDGKTERHSIDLNQLFRNAGSMGSLSLKAGDIIFVPEAELFYIYGEVRKPDSYALKPGMTVMQAISLGGGVTERGSNSRVELRRKDEQGEVRKYSPDLTDKIEADDVIFVKERFF